MSGKKNKDNTKIQRNYFIVALILGLLVVSIVGRAFVTSFVEGKYWIELEEKSNPKPRHDFVSATRGNIYSSDGELMAATET
jgi:cell division protein FtsI/penicillin-binding protein 2